MAELVEGRQRSWQKWERVSAPDNGGGWTTVINETARKIPAGMYRIAWSMELAVLTGGLGSGVRARVTVNSNEKAFFNDRNPDTQFDGRSGWDFQHYDDGAQPTFLVEFRKSGGTDEARIRRIKVSLELMKDD